MERKRSGSLGSFIRPQASSHYFLLFVSLGKSYISSLGALRLKITTKSHAMWFRISILFSELCLGKKPKAIEISTCSSLSATI